MSSVVVDASMAVAWLMPDEQSQATDIGLQALPGLTAPVPTLFRYEILGGLSLDERGVDDDATVLSLAVNHGLTAYDAACVFLAAKSGSVLAALDTKLAGAARRLSIDLVGPLAP